MTFLLLLFTLGEKLGKPKRPRNTTPFLPEPGPDNLGTHPLPPNPLKR